MRSAIRARRIDPDQGRELYGYYRSLEIPLIDLHDRMVTVWAVAQEFDLGFYDAAYVSLSLATRSPLLFADGKLRPKIRNETELRAVWIQDYR